MKNYKIYALKEKNNNEIKYVGLTTRKLTTRFKRHLRDKHISYKTNWINKIGRDNIEIILLEDDITDFNILCEKEIYYIAKYKKLGHKLTNMTEGGDGALGLKFTDEQRMKISLNHADVKGNKNPMYGKTHTDEVKKILKDFHTGSKASDKTKKKMSDKKIGENNNKAKLKINDVLNIRKLYDSKEYKVSELALMYNVQMAAIGKIIKRINWKHI